MAKSLDRGADINARSNIGSTPLMVAFGPAFDPATVELPLTRGANVKSESDTGVTALHGAVAHLNIQPGGSRYEYIVRLLDLGADSNIPANARAYVGTPLHIAVLENAGTSVVTLLLERGADVNARNAVGRTAKDYAERANMTAMVRLLNDSGATPTPDPQPDHDTDGDGLIEINDLEQLEAIRYDPDGDGVPLDTRDLTGDGSYDFFGDNAAIRYATAFPVTTGGAVCGGGGCTGYELARSLDFDDPDSYASGEVNAAWAQGAGWGPILQCHGRASACTREVHPDLRRERSYHLEPVFQWRRLRRLRWPLLPRRRNCPPSGAA